MPAVVLAHRAKLKTPQRPVPRKRQTLGARRDDHNRYQGCANRLGGGATNDRASIWPLCRMDRHPGRRRVDVASHGRDGTEMIVLTPFNPGTHPKGLPQCKAAAFSVRELRQELDAANEPRRPRSNARGDDQLHDFSGACKGSMAPDPVSGLLESSTVRKRPGGSQGLPASRHPRERIRSNKDLARISFAPDQDSSNESSARVLSIPGRVRDNILV